MHGVGFCVGLTVERAEVFHFLNFVGAVRAFGLGKFSHVVPGEGAGLPVGTVFAALLQAARVEPVDARVGVAFLRAGPEAAAVESASSVFVGGFEFAGKYFVDACSAAAFSDRFFGFFDACDPFVVPLWGDGGAAFGVECALFGCRAHGSVLRFWGSHPPIYINKFVAVELLIKRGDAENAEDLAVCILGRLEIRETRGGWGVSFLVAVTCGG